MTRLLASLVLFGALWVLFTGGSPASWVVGAPTVILAAWIGHVLVPFGGNAIRPLAGLAFLPYFLISSLRGGWDVAWRALSRPPALQPERIRYRCHLPAGPPRLLFAHVLSLLPGTLFLEDGGEAMELHVLNRSAEIETELRDLEARIARLLRVTPGGSE